VPEARKLPPVEAVYQLIVPAVAPAPSITVPASHLAAGVVLLIVGVVFTVAVTEVLEPVVQPFADAST
jgi:hypothetical protein